MADARVSGRWVQDMSDPQVIAALFQSVTPQTLAAFFRAAAQVGSGLPGEKSGQSY